MMTLRRVRALLALTLGLTALLALTGLASAQQQTVTVQLAAQNNSGQTGTATLTDMGNGTTQVVLNLTDMGATPQPVHIHMGTCASLNPQPAFPLTNMVNGKSETMVKAPLSQIVAQPHAINAHKSAQEVSVYTACGNIMTQPAQAPRTGGGGMAGQPTPLLWAVGAGLLALAAGAGVYARRRQA